MTSCLHPLILDELLTTSVLFAEVFSCYRYGIMWGNHGVTIDGRFLPLTASDSLGLKNDRSWFSRKPRFLFCLKRFGKTEV